MSDITAIILAAGRGLRMGPRGEMTPKGLFRLGEKPLVEESLDTLRGRGVGACCIVTGHVSEAYDRAAKGWGPVELRYNPLFSERGSLYSLLVGIEGRAGGCLILESDFVYEPRAVEPATGDRSWLMTSGPTGAGDEVYVWAEADDGPVRLVDMSKKVGHREEPHFGELVGVSYLSPADVVRMREIGAELMETMPRVDYETGLVALARERAIECHRIDDLAWAEVDDETMFANAQAIYPRIVAARRKRAA